MDEFFNWSTGRTHATECAWAPRVDVREESEGYVVEVDLPGLNREDIDVTLENDVLTISGERKVEDAKSEQTVHRRERFCGKFTRSMSFPGDVDPENVAASFKDGVLKVEIKKSELTKARQIEIR
jgi:HSP20 family protein